MSNQCLNTEQYRKERVRSVSATAQTTSSATFQTRNVIRQREKIKFTQRYKILSATDPNTHCYYTLNQLLDSHLIDKNTSTFRLPSTGEILPLDEAIRKGYVYAQLVSEVLESSNDLYKSIQSVNRYVRINDLRDCSSGACMASGSAKKSVEV